MVLVVGLLLYGATDQEEGESRRKRNRRKKRKDGVGQKEEMNLGVPLLGEVY